MFKITNQKNKYAYSIPLLVLGSILLILTAINPKSANEIVKSYGISFSLIDGAILFIGASIVIYFIEKIQEFEISFDKNTIIKIGKKKIKLPLLIKIWELWALRRSLLMIMKIKEFDIITPETILTKDEREKLERFCKKHSIEFSIKKGTL